MTTASELIDLLGGTTAVARLLGVRPPSVHEWRSKGMPRDKRVLIAVDIERKTAGRLRRWHTCPDDWHRIWPELIGTEGAPMFVATQPTTSEVN
jgi:DNA-binding transcriptional regulator YdaS (Cro superfamily)